MKYLFLLVLQSVLLATSAVAGQLEYDLKVEGMKCAYCAYNVSKQLDAIDGVVAKSVDVDLEQGEVRLRSEKELDDDQLGDVLLQAGFTLRTISRAAATSQPPRHSNETVLLSVTMNSDWLGEGQFDAVLEALGAIAAERSGRVTVVAPDTLETAILKPVLAGRRAVIKVDYDRTTRSDQTVALSILVNPNTRQ